MTEQVYDKAYFDDYDEQRAAFRTQFFGRAQQAVYGRPTDSAPVSNVDKVYLLKDLPDGGVTLEDVGDFVTYFNHRSGGGDRIGNLQRSIRTAQQKRAESERTGVPAKQAAPHASASLRPQGRHRALLHAVFTLMLVFSLSLFLISGVAVLRVQERAATDQVAVTLAGTAPAFNAAATENYESFDGEDRVEIYAVEDGFLAEARELFDLVIDAFR